MPESNGATILPYPAHADPDGPLLRWRVAELWSPALLFMIAALTALSLAAVLPLGQAADEGAHALRVDALSHGTWLGHREGDGGGVTTSLTLLLVAGVTPPGTAQTRPQREAAENVRWDEPRRFMPLGVIAAYFPAVYAPAAATVAVARALHLTPAQAFRAGRRVNALAFAGLGALAVLVARRGRALLAAVLLLPMSLSLAGSLSGDGMLIAAACLAAACLTRRGRSPWLVALLLLTLVGLTKLPYAPLLLAALAIPGFRWPARLALVAAGAVLMLGWAGYNQAKVVGITARAPYEAGPLWPGPPATFDRVDPVAQLHVIEAHPALAATLPLDTLTGDVWIRRHLIGVLGWLHIVLPDWLYQLWTGLLWLLLVALFMERGPAPQRSLLAAAGVGVAIWGITLSQYFTWTPVGALAIEGVQGRYFLPVIPFLAIGVPSLLPGRMGWLPALPLLAGAVGATTLPLLVALASYMP